ncbi:MAG: hypothetical protein QXQ81_00445 [Candidatus Thorarchaeota archaeon]
MPGLVVRRSNGELRWYPFFDRGTHYTFYPSKEHGQPDTGFKIGTGFKFVKYLPGYWIKSARPGPRRIGGGNSLVVLEKDGDLKYYPLVGGTFMVQNAGRTVGKGFSENWDYLVAEWTARGMSDLLVRDDEGRLRLFPWDGTKFSDLGKEERVGEGFDRERFTHLIPGYWTTDSIPDLLAREKDGDLILYRFDGKTFKVKDKPRKIGAGFDKSFLDFWADSWTGKNSPDLIVRKKNGELILYRYGKIQKDGEPGFEDPPYPVVGRGFKDKWTYLVGHYRTPGRPDLLVRDDRNNMRFYPFDGKVFVDLPENQRIVGSNWDFTHMWDFYPE